MACYKKHIHFNLILLLLMIPLLFTWLEVKKIIVFLSFYLFSTFFLHPDLDLARKVKIFSLRGLFSIFFWPYSFFLKHRGISHHWIGGTISRLAYLLILFFLFSWIFHFSDKERFLFFLNKQKEICLLGFLGIFTSDIFHLILDRKT